MELRQLRYFVEVARLNSYSLASKTLFITQSTISQQIRKLEEELGVELLTRDTRHVVLSDYGEQFYPCALQVLEDARAGKDRIRDVVNLNVGTLSVGSTYAFSLLLKQSVLDFYREYPHIKLNIIITSKEELRQKLLDRELDLALTYKSPLGEDRIESHLLFQSRLCLIGRKGTLKGVGSEVSVQDLARFPLALPSKGLQARDTLESILYAEDVDLDIRLEINSVRSLLDLVSNSPLMTMLSEESIHDFPGLEAVPIVHPDGRMDGCYHFLKGTYHKMSARKFVEILMQRNLSNRNLRIL
ncbi:MAG: LysR family transcriptional regulator [Bacteroidaceae bacterium]|nr:LysR family transcriptional regulator [Bacteroidaceae bacterium]MBR6857440.1 LysR family transcriptional regulator [Bacteroidaceae bacterium]